MKLGQPYDVAVPFGGRDAYIQHRKSVFGLANLLEKLRPKAVIDWLVFVRADTFLEVQCFVEFAQGFHGAFRGGRPSGKYSALCPYFREIVRIREFAKLPRQRQRFGAIPSITCKKDGIIEYMAAASQMINLIRPIQSLPYTPRRLANLPSAKATERVPPDHTRSHHVRRI